jgi:hypothetical protein
VYLDYKFENKLGSHGDPREVQFSICGVLDYSLHLISPPRGYGHQKCWYNLHWRHGKESFILPLMQREEHHELAKVDVDDNVKGLDKTSCKLGIPLHTVPILRRRLLTTSLKKREFLRTPRRISSTERMNERSFILFNR